MVWGAASGGCTYSAGIDGISSMQLAVEQEFGQQRVKESDGMTAEDLSRLAAVCKGGSRRMRKLLNSSSSSSEQKLQRQQSI
jgi:hypothetical protein